MSAKYAQHQEKISKIFDGPHFLPPFATKAKVLEFGCGVGALTRQLAHDFPEVKFIGLDINKPLIEMAIQKAEDQRLKNAFFQQNDVSTTTLELPNDFDGAYCRFLLEDLASPVSVIKSMSSFVKDGGWVCAYERLNNFCQVYPHSENIEKTWKAIFEFYRTNFGANPEIAENLPEHFRTAGLKNITTQGFSRVLSQKSEGELFDWYIEAALAAIEQLQESLTDKGLISAQTLKDTFADYRALQNTSSSFILEVTTCVSGIK